MKKLLLIMFIMLMVVLSVVACAVDTETTVKEEPKKEQKEEPKKEPEKQVKKEPVKKQDSKEVSKNEQKMLELFQENFSESNVSFHKESKMYKIDLGDGVTIELAEMINGTKSKEDWYGLVDSAVYASKKMKGNLGSGYSISFTNPANRDNIILLVMDGEVLYDIFPRDL